MGDAYSEASYFDRPDMRKYLEKHKKEILKFLEEAIDKIYGIKK